jgi:putative tryptophan/tyrosine transport system substrate-binding protein
MLGQLKRRKFITLLCGGAAAWPMVARAQQPAPMPVIGFLNGSSAREYSHMVTGFRQGLNEIGYVEGRNVGIEYRWAENDYDQLPALASDLVRRQVAVIAANSPAALPAKRATTTIPIVFVTAVDPVEAGLVASLNRPGGNLTGVTQLGGTLGPKRLELLHELVPTATTIALLINPTNPVLAEPQSRDGDAAARTLGLKLQILHASSERDFDTVFATLVRLQAALVVAEEGLFNRQREQLALLAARYRVPTIYPWREGALVGGLMSYGVNLRDAYHTVGTYTGRILKGEKPAELPVQQAVKVELILNLKTAEALGLTFPITLLGRADEVIQ